MSDSLSFFLGLFSIIFGVGFFNFWRLGEKSVYVFHLEPKNQLAFGVNVLYEYKRLAFGISRRLEITATELPIVLRRLFCVLVVFNISLLTLDNVGFEKLKKLPSKISLSEVEYCSSTVQKLEAVQPKEGCELILRAYKLGYAKSLGQCEPKKPDPAKMRACEKRREDEPYLHYMTRLLSTSVQSKIENFTEDKVREVETKFKLQLDKLEELKDYQSYAIKASPRASHHIWTNLPYPGNAFVQKFRELLRPNYCVKRFQNQTNTIALAPDDERNSSRLFEHVYGQLLFNPKSDITVGFCKEYQIHWNSAPDTCQKLVANPVATLEQENVMEQLGLVLKRHDVTNAILNLEEQLQKLSRSSEQEQPGNDRSQNSADAQSGQRTKGKIIKNKIARGKQQIRSKNEIVSFQCFMQNSEFPATTATERFKMHGSEFEVRTRSFSLPKTKGDSQIAMYNELTKVLENRFHYSQLISRSDIDIAGSGVRDADQLNQPLYLLARLEILKNADIFLGNSWVLDREDLLDVYPYHVHLQNYVKSFREQYQQGHGRL
ncbi:MAG: hypothetical protein OEZ68_04290 [Gammaproteobacteria bacterium]|nr:hypothetical protein [Gammaproteobacteria bacterium]MDH5800007.1 hypothetical protein [Gammaproteobacteria bacterium]